MFDISGPADAVAVLGNTIFDTSGLTDEFVVCGNSILDISFVAMEEISSVANLGRLSGLGSRLGVTLGCPWGAFG